ncbi:shikimate kinase [Flavobacterium sp. MFBS3-15]|uniref:shikimate kinase n=1 Tax=Flavobacterium sp. MFBS3-15 TaxID=2989816 RepID=UPI002235832F|nr:shikimate kinase [Flavobacterium sp. MFBS3-15]MCW4468333.1 shikimate kinase [Flavobacterium sp. MFBS3-15]
MKKIILCGYMASGKTTVAQILGKAMALPAIDLDEIIEQKAGKTVSRIFAEDGEIKFRRLEHESLKELLILEEGFVLSLGGGTPCYANNHVFLQQEDVVSVYLKTGIDEIVKRLMQQEKGRPLLDNLPYNELQEYVAKHLFDRSYYYHQAKHIVATDDKSPGEVADAIMSLY